MKRVGHRLDGEMRERDAIEESPKREVQHLRSQLITIGEQLKSSIRRTADAEQLAQTAQSREREAIARAVSRQQEEIKRYRQQIEAMERQFTKAESDIRMLERERDNAEEEAEAAKDAVRKCKQVISDAKAREEGLEEGRRLGMMRGFSNGRLKGWKVGRQDGFEEGRAYGRQEGRIAGEGDGRRVERNRVMAEFDRYLDDDEDGEGDSFKRTQNWAESVGQSFDEAVAVEASSMQSSSPPIPPLPSPGIAVRRKGPKSLPKLPLSVFTPPSTGASDKFPLPPSPSAVHPQFVIDAQVQIEGSSLDTWKAETVDSFGSKSDGVVVSLASADVQDVRKVVEGLSGDASIIAVSIAFPLEKGVPASPPQFQTSSSPRIHLSTTVTESSPNHVEGISWALDQGYVVDVHSNVGKDEAGWEILEDVVDKAAGSLKDSKGRRIKYILANVLPPPHSLSLPIVKLLTHPTYNAYQSHIATLSLYSNVYLKFLPPAWGEPTPQAATNDLSKEAREWKRRVKMYLGPAVEAFGYQRIIFGTSPSPVTSTQSKAGYWYEIARESLAELGLEQEDIDAVFSGNAKTVYGA
ncbi:hypothetical protein DFH11DRAFT_1686272 [Phellopilus nigrolimitatus]|nr:hypothetical protein DFH11DRAFT_1686272 [Phellopilus nigrolimitatus]